MRLSQILPTAALLLAAGCSGGDRNDAETAGATTIGPWSYDSTQVFPRDHSLLRPEDGVALPDGRLLVVDQVAGLRMVNPDGSSAPFGGMPAAGYQHRPPEHAGGANGISLEPDGQHALVADVFGAAIYRVDVFTGETEKLYQHPYGINAAVRDSKGAIWFTQSAHNTPEAGEPRMFASIDLAQPEGALYRLAFRDGRPAAQAELVVDSLFFANGLVLDEAAGRLYLGETTGGRVLRYRVDLDAGRISERSVFADSVFVDNLELDGAGNLWVASPLTNELLVINTATGERRTVFRSLSPAQEQNVAEFVRRGQAGEHRMALFTPASWAPLPGAITGVILGAKDGAVYLTGLGDALLKLTR